MGIWGYINTKKTATWTSQTGLPLPSVESSKYRSDGTIIHTEDDLVKLKEQYPGMYQKGINSDTPEVWLFTGQVPLFTGLVRAFTGVAPVIYRLSSCRQRIMSPQGGQTLSYVCIDPVATAQAIL